MKKLISTIVVTSMVMGAGSALAWTASNWTASWAENQQAQTQDLTSVDGGANGMISVTTQDQKGDGYSDSWFGSEAWEGQAQGELTKITFSNGFATHSYNQGVMTYGNSNVDGFGYADHFESQSLDSGIANIGDGNGQFSISGMATVGSANSEAYSQDIWSSSSANAGTEAMYENSYEYKNIGATSGIVQTGFQAGHYTTDVHSGNSQYNWWIGSEASAQVNAQQVGGTVATNDGNGTYMAGAGAAEGSVKVTASAYDGSWYYTGDASANASAEQVQEHSYVQAADNGAGQSQWAVGTVGTYNNASVNVSD
jgi:hypothetical protein